MAPRPGLEPGTFRLILPGKETLYRLSYPPSQFLVRPSYLQLPLALHGFSSRWNRLRIHNMPRTSAASPSRKSRIVFNQTSRKIIGVSDIQATLWILDDVDDEHEGVWLPDQDSNLEHSG